jgi:peroxiredoxin
MPPTLRYGELIPDFKLRDTQGQLWTRRNILHHWTLICFGHLSCPPCRTQLDELRSMSGSQSAIQVIGVLSDVPLFGSLRGIAQRFQQEHHLNYPLLLDNNARFTQRVCDANNFFPFNALFDPQGRLRYVFVGYRGNLLEQEINKLMSISRVVVRLDKPKIAPDGILNEQGKITTLHSIINRGWTVLTFARYGCLHCNSRFNLLARFGYNQSIRCYFVFNSPEEAAMETKFLADYPYIHCVSSNPNDLPKKFGAFFVPLTILFYNGRLAYVSMNQSSEDVMLWAILGSIEDQRLTFISQSGSTTLHSQNKERSQ